MKRMNIIGLYFLFPLLLSACNNQQTEVEPSLNMDGKAEILKVSTDLPKNAGWWIVHKDVNTMTINVEAKNVDTVLFWISPTGTDTWGERELIGYDKDGSDGWSLTWDFGNRSFHDRIVVQALGSDGATQNTEIISITSE
ncbi:hypothetical protein [Paenibacillus rhizolycopersici]|uniref:hypothetical protein n=1 Tax=Paenibacillus rhizolycopersici TaxID=2780073 RepID=UPI003D2D79E9